MPCFPSRLAPLGLALLCGLMSAPLQAQPTEPSGSPPIAQLRGTDAEGRVFDLASRRDKVVLLVFWSTACAVCRDKMPELRANVQGWRGQAFELIGVNTDRDPQALPRYQALVNASTPPQQRFTQLWRGAPGHRDSFGSLGALPSAYLIDKQGRVVEHYQGRIPPETWDRIADLL